jgi:hypothetical protein
MHDANPEHCGKWLRGFVEQWSSISKKQWKEKEKVTQEEEQ